MPSDPSGGHRGMIPRDDLPFLPKINWKFWLPVLAVVAAFPVVWMRQRAAEA